MIFDTICEVKIKSQEYLNSIEGWWVQKFIKDYGKENVFNLTVPKITISSLKEKYNEMICGQEIMKQESEAKRVE